MREVLGCHLLGVNERVRASPCERATPELTYFCLGRMSFCMRTTLRLDDVLLRDAKRFAIETGRTLTAVIEDALREALTRRSRRAPAAPTRLPTYGRGGLRAGIDLDDSSALRDAMDDT